MKNLVFLTLLCVASTLADPVDPRGARPVQQGTRSDKCATEKEWPFCTDEQWGSKCPSGCRIQGLLDKYDHGTLTKIEKIRSLLDQNRAKHRSADQVSKQTHDYLKEKLTLDSGNDNSYFDLAQSLRTRITAMKIRIDRQLGVLAALKQRVKDQVDDMQRLEIDIDIKLRSCKGSCQTYAKYDVDQDSYVTLQKQVDQLDSQAAQNIEAVGTLYVMKSRPLKGVIVDSVYKSGPTGPAMAQQKEDMFPDVNTVNLILELEGSSSSPATISKAPGTSFTSSSSSSSITNLGGNGDFLGGGDGLRQPSTSTHVTCTMSTRRTVVQTKDGPVETVEEVMEGGPECQSMTDFTQGGSSSVFPSLTHTSSSSSSSSSSSKIVQAGGTKGSLLDTKSGFSGNPFGDFGADLGGFMAGLADDDVPDFHARSVKSVRTEREAGYIGKDCVDAHRKHLNGETSGLFTIRPGGQDSPQLVEVYCQQEGIMGGWVLVQLRENSALNFNRSWAEYRNAFGSVDATGGGGFWIGNQNLHLLTNQGENMLKVELEDWEGGVANAEFTIRVGSEDEGYPIHVSGYTGDAGDALTSSHNGMKFSTFDKDNDKSEGSCAEMYGGGWWYNDCQAANLNGVYYKGAYEPEKTAPYGVANGVVWETFKPTNYSLKKVKMFIRSAAF
ncbi:fibrinogen alpha chain [Trematomus bernacchii]|uniref:fibrinogen alpha chain n=1 Tax=Trematomus bernacchii TaxID=40690 RepID=UPI00146F6D30|nr:fibrinogen alpha chain [Trematomus bernacchii]